jgi:K+-sensing histidine kinase KdpD
MIDHGNEQGWLHPDVACLVTELKSELEALEVDTDELQHSEALEDGSARSLIAGIDHSISLMRRVILDTLDVRAIETGSFTLERSLTDVRSVLLASINHVDAAERTRISTRTALPLYLPVDRGRLTRAFEALVQVALASSQRSPLIARLDRHADRAALTVLAVGTGAAKRLTDMLRSDRNPAHDWTAEQIGVYVARHTLTAHGGALGADPLHEIGSRLYAELPLGQPA